MNRLSLPKKTASEATEGVTGTVAEGLALAVRKIASIWGIRIGTVRGGEILDVLEQKQVGNYLWGRHKISVWSAIKHILTGRVYIEIDEDVPPPPPQGELKKFKVLHDYELTASRIYDYSNRIKNRHPEVYKLEDESGEFIVRKVYMTEAVQNMGFALLQLGAPSQTLDRAKNRFRAIYDFSRAFTNGSGFNNPDDPPYADFINNRDTSGHLPAFDKVRVCGGATVRGVVVGDRVRIETLNGAEPIEYLKNNPHLYFRAMNSGPNPTDFNQGDGEPVFIPLIAPAGIACYYPKNRLVEVDEIADPYYVS